MGFVEGGEESAVILGKSGEDLRAVLGVEVRQRHELDIGDISGRRDIPFFESTETK